MCQTSSTGVNTYLSAVSSANTAGSGHLSSINHTFLCSVHFPLISGPLPRYPASFLPAFLSSGSHTGPRIPARQSRPITGLTNAIKLRTVITVSLSHHFHTTVGRHLWLNRSCPENRATSAAVCKCDAAA